MDGQARHGQLVVTADHYSNADDELSMEDDNTSGYNCRDIPETGRWSYHASGCAIDINPLINPYHDVNGVQSKNGGPYLDRTRRDPGLLHDGDQTVLAFTDRGCFHRDRPWGRPRQTGSRRSTPRRRGGWPGIFAGVAFGILSFTGFETAANLAEETREPRRNIPLAVLGSVAIGGIFFELLLDRLLSL